MCGLNRSFSLNDEETSFQQKISLISDSLEKANATFNYAKKLQKHLKDNSSNEESQNVIKKYNDVITFSSSQEISPKAQLRIAYLKD